MPGDDFSAECEQTIRELLRGCDKYQNPSKATKGYQTYRIIGLSSYRMLDSLALAAVADANGGQWETGHMQVISSISAISLLKKFCWNVPRDEYLHILATFHIGI